MNQQRNTPPSLPAHELLTRLDQIIDSEEEIFPAIRALWGPNLDEPTEDALGYLIYVARKGRGR